MTSERRAMTVEDVIDLVRAEFAERERETARVMYRRGYLAGHAARRRGAPAVTNPERHARGELRELLR